VRRRQAASAARLDCDARASDRQHREAHRRRFADVVINGHRMGDRNRRAQQREGENDHEPPTAAAQRGTKPERHPTESYAE
jgi:hypothetical protein